MAQDKRIPVPHGLPIRFVEGKDGKDGFERLCKFLELQNRDQKENLLAVEAVKQAVRHKKAHRLSRAERHRELITAYYRMPDHRRAAWRDALSKSRESKGVPGLLVYSLEYLALKRYDAECLDRKVEVASVKESVRTWPDVLGSISDAPEWQHPALSAWPDLHQDLIHWDKLSVDRRDKTAIALFAVATILDDARLLQWAASRVDTLADEFALLLGNPPHESRETEDAKVIETWKQLCAEIAATATKLGGDPPQPQHFLHLSSSVRALDEYHEPLLAILRKNDPKNLLRRLDDTLAELADKDNQLPISQYVDQIGAMWRLAYPVDAEPGSDSLRTDVERVVGELEDALGDWRGARDRKVVLDGQLDEIKQQQDVADTLDRFSAEDREVELYAELSAATRKISKARDRVFAVVAPGDKVFDPRKDYQALANGDSENGGDAGIADNAPTEAVDPDNSEESRGTIDEQSSHTPGDTPSETTSECVAPEPPATEAEDDREREAAERASTGSTETSVAEVPHTVLAGKAPRSPEKRGDARSRPAATALWRALQAKRPGIAREIAGLLDERSRADLAVPSADIIAGLTLATHFQSVDSNVVGEIRRIMEQIDPDKLLRNNWQNDERDAVSLLVFSAALKPALLAPSTGATSVLRRVSFLSEGLAPVFEFSKTVAHHADRLQGVSLDPSLFRATGSDTWRQDFESFATRVRAWYKRAESKRNLFDRANRVWHNLLRSDGCLAELKTLMLSQNETGRSRVASIRKQIDDQKVFHDLVERKDPTKRRGDPIQGKALKQLWKDVRPAAIFSGEWLRLMDAKPGSIGFVGERVDRLRADLSRYSPDAIAALEGAKADESSEARTAALGCARHALDNLLEIFRGSRPARETDVEPEVIRSRDLLFVTDLMLDTSLRPVRREHVYLLDLLVNTGAHARTARDAFEARLKSGDLVGARLAWDLVETAEDRAADQLCEQLVESLERRRDGLRTKLRDAVGSLDQAYCRGQLDVDDRDGLAAELAQQLQAVGKEKISTLPTPDAVAAMSCAAPTLEEVKSKIQASRETHARQARERLERVPASRVDSDARVVVNQAIDQGDILAANEQIVRLENGESIASLPVEDDPFREFMRHVKEIEQDRKGATVGDSTVVRAAARRERVAGVPFDALTEDEAKQAAELLEAWYTVGKTKRMEPAVLRELLRCLGFKVDRVLADRAGRGRSHAELRTEPLEDRTLCPSRQFGSEAGGHYRVLLNWDRPAGESISRLLGVAGGPPTVVLHFGCLGNDRGCGSSS